MFGSRLRLASAPAWLCMLALLSACTAQRQREQLDRTAHHVYTQPLPQLWRRVEAHFRAQGFSFSPPGEQFVLVTDVKVVRPFAGNTTLMLTRYYVRALPLAPVGARVEVYRWTLYAGDVGSTESLTAVDARPADVLASMGGVSTLYSSSLAEEDAADFPVLSRVRLELGEEGPGTAAFERNFFRDLEAEHRLRASLQPELEGDVSRAGGMGTHAEQSLGLAVSLALVEELPKVLREARCGPSIPGLEDAAQAGRVLLLGELHGTVEIPRFVGQLVCHLAHRGVPVLLALSLPHGEQRALERYLASEGEPADVRALTSGAVWHQPHQDGRTSEAVVGLIEQVRRLNRQGFRVSLLAFDFPGVLQGSARDRAMAQRLQRSLAQHPDAALVALTGNVNASQRRGVAWDEDYEPLGWQLAQAGVPLRSLDYLCDPGEAWTCRLHEGGQLLCGVYAERRAYGRSIYEDTSHTGDKGEARLYRSSRLEPFRLYGRKRFFVHTEAGTSPPGFDGIFFVTRISASPPAIEWLRTPQPAKAATVAP